jgi:glycerophosphoryl diester phosphodiesterase
MGFLDCAGPIAMAHRGFTNSRLPMNSLGAFHEAAKLGFRHMETDVRATRDGVLHALLDIDVDGIVTDRADLLRDVLIARGQWGQG